MASGDSELTYLAEVVASTYELDQISKLFVKINLSDTRDIQERSDFAKTHAINFENEAFERAGWLALDQAGREMSESVLDEVAVRAQAVVNLVTIATPFMERVELRNALDFRADHGASGSVRDVLIDFTQDRTFPDSEMLRDFSHWTTNHRGMEPGGPMSTAVQALRYVEDSEPFDRVRVCEIMAANHAAEFNPALAFVVVTQATIEADRITNPHQLAQAELMLARTFNYGSQALVNLGFPPPDANS